MNFPALPPRLKLWAGPFFLLLLTLFLFGDTLFSSQVVSDPRLDVAHQFFGWRQWGFSQLRSGHLPGWNPHVYSGAPYFAGMQSALIYPPNALYLIFPTGRALNWDMALHTFLLGLFVFWWARDRKIGVLGAIFAGAAATLGAPHWFHVFAGHLTNIAAMTWAPLLFLAADWALKNRKKAALALGAFALAMQILAGHAQYVYFSVLALVVYFGGHLVAQKGGAGEKARKLAVLMGFLALGAALAAAQLLPTAAAGREILRVGGLSFERAATFSLPPESALTLLAPYFFGVPLQTFWGRWYGWETTLFFGVTGLLLAVGGMFFSAHTQRRGDTAMVAGLTVLALGASTPLYNLLFALLPGYSSFRGTAKWSFFALLFAALLAGGALDALQRRSDKPRLLSRGALVLGLTSLVFAAAIWLSPGSWWPALVSWVGNAKLGSEPQTYLKLALYQDPQFVAATARFAARGLALGGFVALVAALPLHLQPRFRLAVPLLALLGVVEMLVFTRGARPTFDPATDRSFTQLLPIQALVKNQGGNFRVIQNFSENSGMLTGAQNIGGNDPFILRRYAEFMAHIQGRPPSEASQYLDLNRFSPLFLLLRARFAIVRPPGETPMIGPLNEEPLPHAFLVGNYRVLPERDEIFAAMTKNFDPKGEVLLEKAPSFASTRGEVVGAARVVSSTSDELIIEAETEKPAVLVITDLWSNGWKVESLDKGAFSPVLQPANYIVRGVPLPPGRHRLRVFYEIPGLKIGAAISLLSLVVWLGLCFRLRHRSTNQ